MEEATEEIVRPTLKFSRCSRKPCKRNANANASVVKPKRKRQRKKTDIPIPTFSPVHTLEDMDISILYSPVKEEKEENIVLFLDDNDDDDDDELLMGPPTFAPTQNSKHSETENKTSLYEKENDEDNKKPPPARQLSNDEEKAFAETTKHAANTLSEETIKTIETLLKQVDLTQVTLRAIVNRVAAKHGYEGDKAKRKLVRAHIKTRMSEDSGVDAEKSSPESLAQVETRESVDTSIEVASRDTKDRKTGTKPRKKAAATIKPHEDDLIVSIDGLFLQADAQPIKIRDFHTALEGEYGARLHKTSRAFVKARLAGLTDGEIKPTVSLPSPSSEDTDALLEEASNLYQQKNCSADDDDDTMPMDDDNAPAIDDTANQFAKEALLGEWRSVEAASPPASPEKSADKLKTTKRGRLKEEPADEVIEITDEVDFSTAKRTAIVDKKERAPAKKPAPKKKAAPKKPRTTWAKKGSCVLCTTCICTIGKETNLADTPANMSRNDAEIERALIRRTKKLEGIVDNYQGLLDQVNRELKKHRRAAWKKQEAQVNDGRRLAFGDSRFLPDANVWDEQAEAVHLEALPSAVVREAKRTLFGTGSKCFDCVLTFMILPRHVSYYAIISSTL